MKIYNTLTRTKETFVPQTPGEVRIYSCGVTPYDLSHVGHARSVVVFDIICRYLAFRGYRVTFVRNYTDVDDKIIRRAQRDGVTASEISERFIREFRADMRALGVLPPPPAIAYHDPRATDFVPEMVELVQRLVERGFAYVVDGDAYFEIARFPRYGRLSGKNLDELLAGARVDVDERKRDPRDFALWKAAKPGEPSWPSPWGPGRPGWHIECSVMAMHYLGESFDIHGGGADLIFPHHECEIAQSEAATSRPFARYWVHNGLVNLGAEKMSKSLGNFPTIRELTQRHRADVFRLWSLGTHYRSPVEWSEDRLPESARALERFTRLFHDVQTFWTGAGAAPALPDDLQAFGRRFGEAMDDDFNTPQARGVLFDLSHALYERRERAHGDAEARAELVAGVEELRRLGGALGLFQAGHEATGPPPGITALVDEREDARRRRDWQRSDRLREEIHRLGWQVEDTAAGPRVTRRSP